MRAEREDGLSDSLGRGVRDLQQPVAMQRRTNELRVQSTAY